MLGEWRKFIGNTHNIPSAAVYSVVGIGTIVWEVRSLLGIHACYLST